MKNKEKFEKEILELACDGKRIAIDRQTGEFRSCYETPCIECLFHSSYTKQCIERIRKWADSEPWLIEDLKKLEVVDSYE